MSGPFKHDEYEQRVQRAQALMHDLRFDAIVVSSEQNVGYFCGFKSDMWVSPTRPWFLIIPRSGEPSAVIPQGADEVWNMTSAWSSYISWPSPRPEDEGVSDVAAVVKALPRTFGRIGLEMGPESRIGMTLQDAMTLIASVRPLEVGDCSDLCRSLRIIKSPTEVDCVRRACLVASDAFDALGGFVTPGSTEKQVARRFMASMIAGGADKVPFLAMASGQGGYSSIIHRPSDREIQAGDILAIDTGATVDEYFCDFDRNLAIGRADAQSQAVYRVLHAATEAGIAALKPGGRASDLWHAQYDVIVAAGLTPAKQGRYGHGLGLGLTEWPSNAADDATLLRPGMIMTIEPGITYGQGQVMVTEENLVITDDGCELLSRRAPPELPVVAW